MKSKHSMRLCQLLTVTLISPAGTSTSNASTCEVGSTTSLRCYTTKNSSVDWTFIAQHSAKHFELCTSGNLHGEYRKWVYIDRTATGDFNLVIRNVTLDDAGTYICSEEDGLGQRHTIQLIVQELIQVVGVVSNKVVLPCHSSSHSSVDWIFVPRGSRQQLELCTSGNVHVDYRDRMSLDTAADGDFGLIIREVMVNDSGVYTCVEDDGLGKRHDVEIIVEDRRRIKHLVCSRLRQQKTSSFDRQSSAYGRSPSPARGCSSSTTAQAMSTSSPSSIRTTNSAPLFSNTRHPGDGRLRRYSESIRGRLHQSLDSSS